MFLPLGGTPAGRRKNRGKFAPVFGECFESTKHTFVGPRRRRGTETVLGGIFLFSFLYTPVVWGRRKTQRMFERMKTKNITRGKIRFSVT